MNFRTLLAILLAVPLTLAGCLGGDGGALAGAGSTDAAAADNNVQPAAAAGTTPEEAPAAEAQSAAAPVNQAVLWNGKLGTRACVPAGPNTCMSFFSMGGHNAEFLKLDGAPVGAALTLTWASAGPHDEQLDFMLLDVEGEESSWSGDIITEASGASPLTIETSDIVLAPGRHLVIAVWPTSVVPDPLYAFVETGTSFKVEGTVTVRPAVEN